MAAQDMGRYEYTLCHEVCVSEFELISICVQWDQWTHQVETALKDAKSSYDINGNGAWTCTYADVTGGTKSCADQLNDAAADPDGFIPDKPSCCATGDSSACDEEK
jgi:hypothetical protein